MKAIESVANFITALRYENIPSPVTAEAKKSILDCIGVSMAAVGEPCLNILLSLIHKMGGLSHSTLLGANLCSSPTWAALYNGTMAHALDFDDGAGLQIPLHPSAPVLPAVIALGEFTGASGKQISEAYICGIEVECKLARGCSRESYDFGWHATGVFGTMGSAAASARILDLDDAQAMNAISIALSLVGGARQNFGTMVKPLHAGEAAMNGVFSAMLAKEGYEGSNGALDGPAGFSKLFGGKNITEECNALGNPYHLAGGVSIKKYPSCYATHSAIDATMEILEKHKVDYMDIRTITCYLNPLQLTVLTHSPPTGPLEAKFNIPFLLALACIHRSVELKHFNAALLNDKMIMDLSRRVSLSTENNGDPLGSMVTVQLMNNQTYSITVDKPRGHPKYPLSLDEVKVKFKSCMSILFSENQAERVMNAILQIEQLGNICSLTRYLQNGNRQMDIAD